MELITERPWNLLRNFSETIQERFTGIYYGIHRNSLWNYSRHIPSEQLRPQMDTIVI
jgi:hypothetical protein